MVYVRVTSRWSLPRAPTGSSWWLFGSVLIAAACSRRPTTQPALTVVGFGLEAGERLRRDALNDFTASTGIRVDLIPAWGSSAEQLTEAARLLSRRSNPPDIFVLDVVWPGTLAADLLDLHPYDDGVTRAHLPALLANDTADGRLVAVPLYVNVGVLYYRTDLLKKYGYDKPPPTWDELESMAARIQQGERKSGNSDFWGYVWQGASYEGLTCDALEWQAAFGGGKIIESDHTISVNNSGRGAGLRDGRSPG